MEQYQWESVIAATWPSVETTKLIRKLRWIGLEEEASRFQDASGSARPRQQGVLAEIPYSTD